jgi:hypothetical protein
MKIVSLKHANKQVKLGKWVKLTAVNHDGARYIAYNDIDNHTTRHSYDR